MALDTVFLSVTYSGNGSTSLPYYINFPFLQNPDYVQVETSLDDGLTWYRLAEVEYTVVGAETASPYVTTTGAYPSSTMVRVFRELPLLQPIVLPNAGRLPTEALDRGFDRAAMQIQQVNQRVTELKSKAFRTRVSEADDANNVFPQPAEGVLGYSDGALPKIYTPEEVAIWLDGKIITAPPDDLVISAVNARLDLHDVEFEEVKELADPVQIQALADNRRAGIEYMFAAHSRLIAAQSLKILLTGDSTTNQSDLAAASRWDSALPAYGMARGFGGITAVNRGQNGASSADWLSTFIAGDLAEDAHVVVIGYCINDAFYGLTPSQSIANIRAGLTILRTAKTVSQQSIILCLPSSTYDPPNGRVPGYYLQLIAGFRQAARDFKCVLIDKYSEAPDSESGAGVWLDDPYADGRGIHPKAPLALNLMQPIAETIFPSGMGAAHGHSSLVNVSGTLQTKIPADGISAYPTGISLFRAQSLDAWPIDGAVTTFRHANDVTRQVLCGFQSSDTDTAERHWIIGSSAWSPWRYSGERKAAVVPFTGFTLPGSDAAQTMSNGERVMGRGYLDKTSPSTIAAGAKIATVAAGFLPPEDLWGIDAWAWDGTNWEYPRLRITSFGEVFLQQAVTINAQRIYFGGSTWAK